MLSMKVSRPADSRSRTDPPVVDVRSPFFVFTGGPANGDETVPLVEALRSYVALERPEFEDLRMFSLRLIYQ